MNETLFSQERGSVVRLLKSEYLILVFILLIGSILCFYNLGHKSLWYDEACSLSFTEYSWKDVLSHRYMAKPVYFIILKLWVTIFGSSEVAARSLSAIFGVLSSFLIYKLGKLLFTAQTGLVSALIASFSPYYIYYSQEVRGYSLFLFLSVLSIIIFLEILRKNSFILYFFYVLTNVALIYTHAFGISIIIVQNIFFLYLRGKIKYWFIAQFILLVFMLPLLFIFINNPFAPAGNEIDYIPKPNFKSLVETFEVFGYGGPRQAHSGTGFQINPRRLFFPRMVASLFFLLYICGILCNKENITGRNHLLNAKNKKLLLFLLLSFPVIGTFIFSFFFLSVYLTRFFIAASVAFYLTIAIAITQLFKSTYKITLISFIIFYSLYSLNVLYYPDTDDDWRTVAAYVKKGAKKGDSIILLPLRQIVPFWYYYRYPKKNRLRGIDRCGKKIDGIWRDTFFDEGNLIAGFSLDNSEYLIRGKIAEIKNKRDDVWLIVSPYWVGAQKIAGFVYGALEENYILKDKIYCSYNGIEVSHYKLRDTGNNPGK